MSSIIKYASIARPYARAVFDVAKHSPDSLQEWADFLDLLLFVVCDENVLSVIENPIIPKAKKLELILSIVNNSAKIIDEQKKLVETLCFEDRLVALADIKRLYDDYRNLFEKKIKVKITSALPVSESESEKLRAVVGRYFDKQVDLTVDIDKSLIGGIIIRAGDKVIDSSLRGKLHSLHTSLMRGVTI